MRFTKLILFFIFSVYAAGAQPSAADSAAAAIKDSIRIARLNERSIFPVIHGTKRCGVWPEESITEKPDSTMKYKLLIDLTAGFTDAAKVKEINKGLAEIGRLINLHAAAGIPVRNIQVVVVARSTALPSFLNNDAFKQRYGIDNPNLSILKELEMAGAKFIACGQSMLELDIEKQSLLAPVKIAYSAKVALSSYQMQGYALFSFRNE